MDDYLDQLGNPDIGWLKVDVEGFELEVLRGAERLLTERPPLLLQVELIEGLPGLAGGTVDDVVDFLAARGYQPFVLTGGFLRTPPSSHRFGSGLDSMWVHESRVTAMSEFISERPVK